MALYRRRNSVFDRIGDRYGSFIDADHFLGRSAFDESWMTSPAMNIQKNGNHYDLEIALPGYSKNNITISVNNRMLEILAEKNVIDKDRDKGDYLKKEIDTDKIKKTFELSAEIDVEKIDSSFENGLLRIKLPRLVNKESSKMIKVE